MERIAMRRSSLLVITLLLLCMARGTALAEHRGLYIGASGGGSMVFAGRSADDQGSFNMAYRPAVQWGAIIGWDIGPDNPLGGEGRVEIEYSHRSNRLEQIEFIDGKFTADGDLVADTLLVSTCYLHRTETRLFPYFVLGAGAARMAASGLQVTGQPFGSGSAMVFAWQAGAGTDIALTQNVSLDIGYRLFGTSRPVFTEPDGRTFTADYLGHSIILGVRYGF